MKSQLNVHYFQHIAGEGFGSCYEYLKQLNAKITATEFFALPLDRPLDIEALPAVEEVDLLIIMGGTMSVSDEVNFPWLTVEKRWLRRYLSLGRPALGLCLGGQLIANALGAPVRKNNKQELGWHDVYKVANVSHECFQLPNKMNVMQWHSETFEIPRGAVHLAESDVCKNQMYQIGTNVLGFQFHPEITPENLSLFLDNKEELLGFSGLYVQSELELRKTPQSYFMEGNGILNAAVDYVLNKSTHL